MNMSREVGIMAINPDSLSLDGKAVFISNVRYTKDWIEKVMNQNQDASVEGRLIIACSYDAHRWILKAVEYAWDEAHEVCITGEDDIFADPKILLEVILKYWDEWHAEDPRWSWSKEMITEFFNRYRWAIIYIDVY